MVRNYVLVKYTVFVSMVLAGGIAIERLVGIKRWWTPDSIAADDIAYNVSSPLASRDMNSVLSKHYLKCVTEPAKPFCLLSANRRLEILRSEQENPSDVEVIEKKLKNVTSEDEHHKHQIHSLLVSFSDLMTRNKVKMFMIEPSVLFCLLSAATKFGMLSGGFNPGRFLGSKNVVTIGVLEEDSKKLQENQLTKEALSSDFKIIKYQKWIGEENFEKYFRTAHYFFVKPDAAVHVVVFFPRRTYLWHAGLDPKEIEFEGLLFVNEEIFENFTLSPLNLAKTSISGMYLPDNVRYFMKQIESSKVVECRANLTANITNVNHYPHNLTLQQLHKRAIITIKELKALLSSQLAFFWLWSKSLLGWYDKCNIFYHSATLNLALTYKSIQGLNFTQLLDDNEFLKVARDIKSDDDEIVYKLDCHGLQINIFVLLGDENGLWQRMNKNRKLIFPDLQLCSSQVLGEKIHVPCNSKEILSLEPTTNQTHSDFNNS